jgi:cell wall-associated NlpC family hydrolase
MSIARRAAAYAALSAALAIFTIALIAALPGVRAWAAPQGGISPREYEPETETTVEEGGEEGAEGTAVRQAMLVRGRAVAPLNAPLAVRRVINAANKIRTKPYVWGGGHGRWIDRGYDCSGSVSFALHGGGLLEMPLTSGSLEAFGKPGPGRWITIYANASHVYAVIAGLRWDTAGNLRGTGPRWHKSLAAAAGGRFIVRHPEGL